ncbi:mitochondrial carrier domain-containing protein [Hypoxylon rubiginosum]|uniref:Mitochondrial carrier domain-containing protein n=1 Tax=Hypoxylon rubiginosum TaxID=110542 RepID=A0ACB9YJR1_9PEZI|nr:mitochondrial carrier domain-containing protein [Hypoxylon rubiginosum]
MPSSSLPNNNNNNTGISISADKFLPALQHAVSGSAGTLISTCALYPLSLAITRLQLQRQLRREGRLRRGKEEEGAGAAAGTTTTTTDPRGRAGAESDPTGSRKDDDDSSSSIAGAFSQIWSSGGGPRAFYTGLAHDATRSVLDSFLFFLFYEWFRGLRLAARRRRRHDHTVAGLAVLEELAVGVAAGACSRLFTTPIANVVARQQTASLVNSTNKEATSAREILADIRREKGLAGLWSGYSASLVLTLNPSITFFLQEFLGKRVAAAGGRRDRPAGGAVTFLLAAASKAVACVATYPLQTARTRMQAGVIPAAAPPGRERPKEESKEAPPKPRVETEVDKEVEVPKGDAPREEALIDLASVEAQASEGAKTPKDGEGEAKASAEGEAPAEAVAAAAKEPEAPLQPPPPPPPPPRVIHENVAPPERSAEREVDAKLDALRAVRDFGRQSVLGTAAQIARAEGVGALYDGLGGELLRAFLGHGTTMLAKEVVHRMLFRLYIFVASVLAELRARRAKRVAVQKAAVTARASVRESVPRPSAAPRPEPVVVAPAAPTHGSTIEATGPPPKGAPQPVRLVPELPSPYPPAPTPSPSPSPSPRAPAYLPPPPPPPPLPLPAPAPTPQQLPRSLRYRIDGVSRYDSNAYSPSPYQPSYPYRPSPPPAAPATDVSVRTRMSRNDIERATPSSLGDFAVNVVANMIDGTQRGFRDG